ncbi:Brp/Blh family beta-carotene 15,15'-dioxygenase [Pelagibacteraceae bacterium]|nr:Brp/Blh family beta-carotene 15,15'-dioxygenase [Pelagibacteraceae bacterium]
MILDLTVLNIISFLLIFFIGLPHGSFDGAVASLVGFRNKTQFLKFLFYYLFLFFIVILFWLYFPIISLIIFIAMTIAHFGLCDWTNFKIKKYKYIVSFTYGMTIIFGIIYFNENQSFEIFKYLTNDKVFMFQRYLFFPYLTTLMSIIFFIYLSLYEKKLRKGVIEIVFLLTIFYIFDPLLSFAIYFCFFHTYKHLKHLIKNIYLELPNKNFVIYTTITFTIISWFAGIIIIFFLIQDFTLYESVLKVIFIGLAALTLPHMVLVDIIYRKKFK